MHTAIVQAIADASSIDRAVISAALVRPKEIAHGDYAFPCFALAKAWKIPPTECARKLAAEIKLPAGFSKLEVAGAYLNFFLDRTLYAKKVITAVLSAGLEIGKRAPHGRTVVLDYSHPNIAKPFHVGHLRTTLIGHALHRIHQHLGWNTVAVNHLGDWGTQFGFVYAGCKIWGRPENAEIEDLVSLYQRASRLRKAQDQGQVPPEDAGKPDVNAMARDYFRRLEAGDAEAREFWQWCLDISLDYFKRMYQRMGIHFDYYHGESFYEDKLGAVERMIRESGLLENSRGALGVDLGKPLGFVRIFAEDGRSLYITRDIAAADYRLNAFCPEKILYIVGAPQILHFQQLKAVLAKMKHPAAELIVHIPFGHVVGVSTRNASEEDRVFLKDLLDDAHARALTAYHNEVSKRPADLDDQMVAECVGLGAIFFGYLSRVNIKDFNFDWDEALNFHGDTGPYIQYALARLYSISAKAAEAGIQGGPEFDPQPLCEDSAYSLVSQLGRFEETVQKSADSCEPYHLANYLLDIAKSISSVYKTMRVVGEEDAAAARARLALFVAARCVLHTGLGLLGVPPLERM